MACALLSFDNSVLKLIVVVTLAITGLLFLDQIPLITPALAQGQTVITGAVQDASGAVIPQAAVTVVVTGRTVATTTTGSDGRYRVEVPKGVPFELRVQHHGFADGIVAFTGTALSLTRDITLQIGGVSDALVVTASRGYESRTTATPSMTVMTRAEIDALGSASLADVIRFVPGVSIESTGRDGAVTSMFSRGGESATTTWC
jgi:hypothetical protein